MTRIPMFGMVALLLCGATAAWADDEGLRRSVESLTSRYALRSLYASTVDDHGRGKPELRGVRNFRAVLPGILYRSGANNSYRGLYGLPKLPNNGPLPDEGLTNLCREGFSKAYYLYGAADSKTVLKSCETGGSTNTLVYNALHPHYSEADRKKFLTDIHQTIVGRDYRPVLVHCWNGYHASGVASAIALRQFCGLSAEDAVEYWNNTATPLEEKARARSLMQIRSFKPLVSLAINNEQKQAVCFHGPIAGGKAVWRFR